MLYRYRIPLALLIVVALSAIVFALGKRASTGSESFVLLTKQQSALKSLHKKMSQPRQGDWLASHEESGQTFGEYVQCLPNKLTSKRNVLYVQPIGNFDRKQTEIVNLSAEFMGLYFSCSVEVLETLPESVIPDHARRVHPTWDVPQILTTHVLHDVLKPELPDDAFALIAFTSSDLWPGDNWNFVFGQASLRERVGVWSINRNGNPNLSEFDFQLCLERTIKVATHETGHMFSMQHCIEYECNMCGSNSLAESDRYPIYLCPKCMAKVVWSTECDPVQRYESLADFCGSHEMDEEAKFYRRSIATLKSMKTPKPSDVSQ